jgi:hypothetical protein
MPRQKVGLFYALAEKLAHQARRMQPHLSACNRKQDLARIQVAQGVDLPPSAYRYYL